MDWRPDMLASGKPKYLALVELIEGDIAAGELRDGDRLPPQREIADRLDLTVATITKAIGEAARRGLVTARTGSGTFVRIAPTTATTANSLDLSLNVVPLQPVKRYLDEALAELGRRRATDEVYGYEAATGSAAHRATMARWLKARGLPAKVDNILLTHGSQHGLSACFRALTRPSEIVLCEQWTYTGIRRLAEASYVRLEGVAMDAEGLIPGALLERLKATEAKMVICSAVVQNPTTATMSLERRKTLAEICDRAGAILVEDDIYGHLSGEDAPPIAALAPRTVVHISSLSKCLAPAFRLGTLTAPDHLAPSLADALVTLHWTGPALWASLFEVLLVDGAFETCLSSHRDEARRRMNLYAEIVGERSRSTLPSYHVWQSLPAPWRSDDFVTELAAEGVRVSPAHHFSTGPASADQAYLRICLGGGEPDPLRQQLLRFRAVAERPRVTATIS